MRPFELSPVSPSELPAESALFSTAMLTPSADVMPKEGDFPPMVLLRPPRVAGGVA